MFTCICCSDVQCSYRHWYAFLCLSLSLCSLYGMWSRGCLSQSPLTVCAAICRQTNFLDSWCVCFCLRLAPSTVNDWICHSKCLALQQHSSSDPLLAAVFDSHDWTLGDLCIQPSPLHPELLPKVTLMKTDIILRCRIRRKRWGISRLWISYRDLLFLLWL